jgi:hypothetical protein
MDIYHKLYKVARQDRLFSAPVNILNDSRVLDLGAGTGIWVIDMAGFALSQPAIGAPKLSALPLSTFHSPPARAFVQGIDFAMIQPDRSGSPSLPPSNTTWRRSPFL